MKFYFATFNEFLFQTVHNLPYNILQSLRKVLEKISFDVLFKYFKPWQSTVDKIDPNYLILGALGVALSYCGWRYKNRQRVADRLQEMEMRRMEAGGFH